MTYLYSACDKYNFELLRRVSKTFKATDLVDDEGSFKIQVHILCVPDGEPSGMKLDQYENIVRLSIV